MLEEHLVQKASCSTFFFFDVFLLFLSSVPKNILAVCALQFSRCSVAERRIGQAGDLNAKYAGRNVAESACS